MLVEKLLLSAHNYTKAYSVLLLRKMLSTFLGKVDFLLLELKFCVLHH